MKSTRFIVYVNIFKITVIIGRFKLSETCEKQLSDFQHQRACYVSEYTWGTLIPKARRRRSPLQ